MNRRNFLRGSGLAAAACAAGGISARGDDVTRPVRGMPGGFTFAFFTDVHIEPEMDAPEGTALAMEVMNASEAEFAICGGDHVFDALSANKSRIVEQYALYAEAEKALKIPVRHVLGNHDVAGLDTGMSSHDPVYGKAMFEKTFNTPTYYSFLHKGVNFIVLDSILISGRSWVPMIAESQVAWLEKELEKQAGLPTIVISHVPLATSIASYCRGSSSSVYDPVANSSQILPLLERYGVMVLLQGHTHIVESVRHHGIEYLTGGAVCGAWWRGAQFGDREGVTLVTVEDGSISSRYVPTGFVSMDGS
jgi:Icc protein